MCLRSASVTRESGHSDKPERIEFITANNATHMIDNVIDTFGRNVNITDIGDGNYKFLLHASPAAMHFWLFQYGKYVKLLSPQSHKKEEMYVFIKRMVQRKEKLRTFCG